MQEAKGPVIEMAAASGQAGDTVTDTAGAADVAATGVQPRTVDDAPPAIGLDAVKAERRKNGLVAEKTAAEAPAAPAPTARWKALAREAREAAAEALAATQAKAAAEARAVKLAEYDALKAAGKHVEALAAIDPDAFDSAAKQLLGRAAEAETAEAKAAREATEAAGRVAKLEAAEAARAAAEAAAERDAAVTSIIRDVRADNASFPLLSHADSDDLVREGLGEAEAAYAKIVAKTGAELPAADRVQLIRDALLATEARYSRVAGRLLGAAARTGAANPAASAVPTKAAASAVSAARAGAPRVVQAPNLGPAPSLDAVKAARRAALGGK